MRLVPSTPNSRPVPEAVRGALAAVSPEDLREIVERIAAPRPTGTPENLAVRRTILDSVLGDAGRSTSASRWTRRATWSWATPGGRRS